MPRMKIDFGDVDPEIRRSSKAAHVPEGEYLVKIVTADVNKSERSGSRYIRWKTSIVSPEKYKGKNVWGSTSLKKEALWALRNLIFAATGRNVAGKSSVAFDPENLYGKIVGASIEDNEYTRDGKTRVTSQISTFFPKDDYTQPEDEEEAEEEEEEEEEEAEEEEEDLEDVDSEEI